jgi:zinc transport system ATP-binding protein
VSGEGIVLADARVESRHAEPAVSFAGVSFSFGAVPVLEDVTLSVREREFASIVGPNGAGKSTLLKLILGLLRPNTGEVRVFGERPTKVRQRIGYTPQHAQYDPLFPISVLEVVLMGRLEKHWGGRYSRADKEAARRALKEVALEDLEKRPFGELSGGQRQRVLIARSLVGEPDLLLLDEPTANVDAKLETQLLTLLKELNQRMTILLVSHDLGFVSSVVESVICVSRRVAVHPTSELTGEAIRDIYGGDVRMVRHDHRCAEEGHQMPAPNGDDGVGEGSGHE